MDFKTPNKSWLYKKLMRLGKNQLWKFAISYDSSIKNFGIDYFTMTELSDIINYELLKIEKDK